MGFSRSGYWSGLPFPPPGDLPDPGIELGLLHWQVDSLPLSHREAQNRGHHRYKGQGHRRPRASRIWGESACTWHRGPGEEVGLWARSEQGSGAWTVPRARARATRRAEVGGFGRGSLRKSVQMLQCRDRRLQGNSGLKGRMHRAFCEPVELDEPQRKS